jgi:hypothetical protein
MAKATKKDTVPKKKAAKKEMTAQDAMKDVYKGMRKAGAGDPYGGGRMYLGDGVWLNSDGSMDDES